MAGCEISGRSLHDALPIFYKFGGPCSPDERAQSHANRHVIDCIRIAKAVGSEVLSVWLADGTNYPGQDDIVTRKHRLHGALDRKSTRLNSSHLVISYADFC